MTKPMSTAHVGESVEVMLTKLELGSGGGYIADATVAVTIVAPSGTNPDASVPELGTDEDGAPCSRATFVPLVDGEHVVKTHADADGVIFRHRERLEVEPW
jgi:hypothetical protein